MNYFQVGNLTVPATWIAVLAALILANILNRLLGHKKVSDWYGNSFFLYFVIWKLSYILFNIEMFINVPCSIIYFNGGVNGQLLALIFLSFYLLFIAPNKYPSIHIESPRIFLLFYFSYEVILNIIVKDYLGSLILSLPLITLLFILKNRKKLVSSQLLILLMLLEILFISLFGTLLSIETLSFIWIGIIILIISRKQGDQLLE